MRVARFEVDPRSARAVRHLATCALVPRSRRERWALAIDATLRRVGLSLPPARLAAPAPCGDSPAHEEALEAAFAILPTSREPLRGGLDLLAAPHHGAPARLLFLWRDAEPRPFALAKVLRSRHAGRLVAEGAALDRLTDLPEDVSTRAPRVLGRGAFQGLQVLVQSTLPGCNLARFLAGRRAGSWPEPLFRELGLNLGALHAAGLGHGDAWSRNAMVHRSGRFAGFVDWEASGPSRATGAEALRFLVTSARTDLTARGPKGAELAEDADSVVERLFGTGRRVAACRAFLAAWSARHGQRPSETLDEAAPATLGLPGSPSAASWARLRAALSPEEES